MRKDVLEAFLIVRNGMSPDVVVADPQLNQLFVRECRARRLTDPIAALNATLLNLRKSSNLQGIPRSKRMVLRGQDEYKFASEIAVRLLERREQVSLDRILCDPNLAAQFDKLAAAIAPGFSSFQYRWAAFGLRKRSRLKPELLARVVRAETIRSCKVRQLQVEILPVRQGLYVFYEPTRVLYVGECTNLRKRIRKHLEHSDNKELARWLWASGTRNLHLEYHVLPNQTTTRVRKALETELIDLRKPVFNVRGL
jgi:site-specific DNA-methyltransferase (adenine-specific)